MKKLFMLVAVLAVSGVLFTSAVPDCPPPNNDGHAVYLPNLDDCSTFFECYDGYPILQECPEGLLYCSELEICSWEWDASCTFNCTDGGGNGGGNTGGGGSTGPGGFNYGCGRAAYQWEGKSFWTNDYKFSRCNQYCDVLEGHDPKYINC